MFFVVVGIFHRTDCGPGFRFRSHANQDYVSSIRSCTILPRVVQFVSLEWPYISNTSDSLDFWNGLHVSRNSSKSSLPIIARHFMDLWINASQKESSSSSPSLPQDILLLCHSLSSQVTGTVRNNLIHTSPHVRPISVGNVQKVRHNFFISFWGI